VRKFGDERVKVKVEEMENLAENSVGEKYRKAKWALDRMGGNAVRVQKIS